MNKVNFLKKRMVVGALTLLSFGAFANFSWVQVGVDGLTCSQCNQAAKITQYGVKDVPISTPLLEKGNYVDICPGLQAIINSNFRIDLSLKFPLISKSFAHFYPVYSIGIQRYFYQKTKS